MNYKGILLVCCIIFERSCCRHVTYPSGEQVWVQKVKVIEVNEHGHEVLSPSYGDFEIPDFDVRTPALRWNQPKVVVWVEKVEGYELYEKPKLEVYYAAVDARHCPGGVRVGGKCVKKM
ncbi:hypothetical protein B5X24_HaOG204522 [Helicoverpa armigera]|uniref:Uncharacterized protein n=1 Tax=Helicoverpa armigera TaxID=29058 RepID=A0A2W1BUK1_HELAM|nr:hypothetical protein B5X24_HaOG204522 [Helicoverpa armigera]